MHAKQDEVIKRFHDGETLKKMRVDLKIAIKTIKKILIKNGIDIKSRKISYKNGLKANYFENIDTPLKAYFLGFLFADGFVLKNGMDTGMNLSVRDAFVLEKLSEELFEPKRSIYYIKRKEGQIGEDMCRLIIKSREFQKHLIDKNMVHNKSLILTPPKNLPEKYTRDFILGYFDGDGCFSKPMLSIVSTLPFLEWIGEHLKEIGVSKINYVATKNKITHRLNIFRKHDLVKIYNYFYLNNPNIFLDRKRIKLFDFLSKNSPYMKVIFKFDNKEGFSELRNSSRFRW